MKLKTNKFLNPQIKVKNKTLKTTLLLSFLLMTVLVFNGCKKDKEEETPPATTTPPYTACTPSTAYTPPVATTPKLIFKFKFDSTQARLNNFGNPSTVPAGNAAQSPIFHYMSQHYIELAGDLDAVGAGKVLHIGSQTTAGGTSAIDYCASVQAAENATFFSIPLDSITPGSYKWLRVSLAYQNYTISYKSTSIPGGFGTGTLASFIGFKTYIPGYQITGSSYQPSSGTGGSGNHNQGYWGFKTTVSGSDYFFDGQSAGTTVPNPLFVTSPIPSGSCLVTGQFVDNVMANSPLIITGLETADIVITVSLSTNNSFEWTEVTADGYYQPDIGESVVDMGIRGLIPIKN